MYTFEISTKKEKWASWYTMALVVSLTLIIWWIYSGIFFLPIVVLIMIWVYFLVENNTPDTLNVEINEYWILVWDAFYEYSMISWFSIIYNRNKPLYIRLKLNETWTKTLDIPLENVWNTWELKLYLKQYIEELKDAKLWSLEQLANYLKL